MPQGIQRGAEVDLSDRTYDGREESGYLSGGLGQLVDGQKGQDIFRLDLKGHGKGKYFLFFSFDGNRGPF
jgi:discoidin domain receptor family protein 2